MNNNPYLFKILPMFLGLGIAYVGIRIIKNEKKLILRYAELINEIDSK